MMNPGYGGQPYGEPENEMMGTEQGAPPNDVGPGGIRRPYGSVQSLSSAPQMGGGMSEGANAERNLAQLPPDQQEMVMMVLGSDPMIASALLQVLGPSFGPIISKALKSQAPQAADPMAGIGGVMPQGMTG